ncbi:uncharacterized protein LOC142239764 [Haematobia irritans]|uniref:uncharacterized protein LOC142239764 n=1 Tax=Haematobia irritans TaxID=7368 RepID=UPI003F4F6F19
MSETDFNCNKCDLKDTDRMVQCDSCDKWFHFECVKVDSNIANVSWSCSCCVEQPVDSGDKSNATQQLPPVDDTTDFTTGTRAASSPATGNGTTVQQNAVHQPFTQIGLPSAQVSTSQRGAYANAHNLNLENQGSSTLLPNVTMPKQISSMAPTNTTMTLPAHKEQYIQRHFNNSNGSNVSPCNSSSQTQLQLQMLEEEKELQRQYLEKKYHILSQGNLSQPSSSFANNTTSFHPTPTQIAARQVIPKELPNFDGNPEDWPLFISNYRNSTEIAGYSDGENLMRLQSCLRGRAKELVKSKLLIPSMVNEIIQTLEMCFGRPEHILDSMIEKATKIPPLKDRLDSLIEYALTVRNICSTMEACNLVAHLNNPMLVKTLVEKLPNNQKLNWAMHIRNEKVPIVKEFSDWIYAIAAAASQVVSPTTSKKGASVNTHQQNNTSKPICFSCKSEAHKIQNCGEFQSFNLDAKWNVVKENKLCRQCLNLHRRKCFSNRQCGINGCAAKHHSLLHKYTTVEPSASNIALPQQSGNVNTHNNSDNQNPYFRILPIKIYFNGGSVNTFAFLDEGSSVTLMEHEFYNQLGLKGESEPLELKWTGNTTRSEDDSVRLNVEVSGVNGSKYVIYNVHTVQNLGLPTQSLDFESIVKDNPYFKGLPIQSYENVKPTILIGVNNWRVAVPLKVREGGRNLLIATKTRLGWTLQGCGSGVRKSFSLNIHTCACEDRYKNLHNEVKEYFALEVAQEKTLLSFEDQKAMQILENNVIRKGQQFEVSLLWKDENPVLPESYEVACHRLKCLQKKFKKDPQLQQTMQVEIDKLLNKGYARKVTNSEFNSYSRTWYLPIFVALNPNKPGKVRLVWDAAAKSNNKSLNDFLMSGPDLLTSLINVLLEFRVGQIAVCGDIAEMFHRINVNDVDMHAQRFLWIKDGEVIAYVMKALTFGTSCAPCIANFVRNKNAEDFRDLYPRAVKAINFYHYMDDFIDSVQTEEEAIKLANQVKTIHAKGGFHMRNWASNSNIVRQKLAEGGAATENSFGAVEKILGMYWESNNDVFQYNCRFSRLKRNVFQRHTVPTKREVLQVLMSIFDPLGFVSHYTISLKILLQDIWRSAIKWDDELNEDLHIKWCSWLSNLEKISTVSIPRCYSRLLKSTLNVQLHTFVDAGENAYAAVCYFRIQYQGEVDVRIVAAKGKVSPLKPVSIPRLELQAALIGARLSRKIIKTTRLNCTECFYWSDSKTVLKWLSMDPKNFKAFVMYRVGEILELTNLPQWNWVPSKLNPADFATKVCSAEDDMWFQGPEFLKDNEDVWPKCSDLGRISYEEVRNHLLHRRLYRALAQFLFYMEKLKSVVQRSNVENDTFFECIQKSKYILYKYAQKSEFSEEIWHLKNKKPIEKDSILKQLNICLDENYVIRAYGRAEMLNCNNAIILPTNHYITFLVVKYYHENYHHCLHEATISRIKSNFYVPKLRVVYKKVRSSCQHCKNLYAVPRPPQMATLPSARLSSFERPFTYVGIDFFGPLFVTVGRHREKRWGVLFTCLTVRAIHIEVAHSLDTSSCILCIQNFISRRGSPKEIYTDNGTNFKAVEKILREEKQHIDLHQVFSKYDDIKWRFNPPAAPHMGGAWERLIRTVKSVLYSMLPAFKFNDETLRSALYEIEFMINSRPLTFVALDSDDDDALTPNHLLLGSAGGQKPLCEFDYDLRQRWHNTQKFANHFWRRWVREYGPHLVRRSKWLEKVQPPSKGDVVIIVDDNLPRNSWPKGILTELYTAKDGQVRRVKVKTTSSTYERPVTKIAILDVGKRSESKLLGP